MWKFWQLLVLIKVAFSYVSILGPEELRKQFRDGLITASLSNFGKIPYGFSLVGRLHWDINNKDVDMACKPINNTSIPALELEVDQSPILMVDRGNCSFVTKVRNVENAGGKVALIVNNENSNVSRIIMSDDGTGKELTIPALLISLDDGLVIKNFFTKYQNDQETLNKVTLDINFEIEQKKVVEVKLFLSSEMLEIYEYLEEFSHYMEKLGAKIVFTPYYVMKESDFYDENNPKNIFNCVSGGRFCASKVRDLNITEPTNIINENIRQKCIYKEYSFDTYNKYMNEFHKQCLNKTNGVMFNVTCSSRVISILNIDSEKISGCLQNSFEDYSNFRLSRNTLLEGDAYERKQLGAFLVPSVMINGRRFSGSLKGSNVFEGVCAGFLKKPDICFDEGDFRRPPESSSLSWGMVFFIIFIVLIVNLMIYLLCRRYISKKIMERLETTDINHRINTVVTSYLALKENK